MNACPAPGFVPLFKSVISPLPATRWLALFTAGHGCPWRENGRQLDIPPQTSIPKMSAYPLMALCSSIKSRGQIFSPPLHRKSSHDSHRQTTVLEVHLIKQKIDLYTKKSKLFFKNHTRRSNSKTRMTQEANRERSGSHRPRPHEVEKILSWEDAHTDLHPHE